MNRKGLSTNKLVQIAVIGALYTVLTFASGQLAFGTVQFRLSEVLTLLPLFSPVSIWGLVFGCFFSNVIGFMTGINPIGLIDALVGTGATLLAALITYAIGRLPDSKRVLKYIFAPLPPVIFNGIIVGLELTFVFSGEFIWEAFWANLLSVAIGEAVVCYLLGLIMVGVLYRNDFYKKIFPCLLYTSDAADE